MNIDLSKKQLQDIQFALCIAMSHTEKNTKLNVEEHPLIKRYIETYDQFLGCKIAKSKRFLD